MNDNTNVDGKKCRICGEFKEFSEFYKRKESKDGYRNDCIECNNKQSRKYRVEHLEEVKVKSMQYRRKNSEIIKENNKSYYEQNSEQLKQYQKDYRRKNKILITQDRKLYYQKNSEKIKDRMSKYRKINNEKVNKKYRQYIKSERGREYSYLKNAKRRSYKNKVSFTPIDRKRILDSYKWICQSCGCKVHDRNKGNWNTPDKAHIDHIIPISKGGHSEPSNLQVLCRTCNLSKRDTVEKQMEMDFNTI